MNQINLTENQIQQISVLAQNFILEISSSSYTDINKYVENIATGLSKWLNETYEILQCNDDVPDITVNVTYSKDDGLNIELEPNNESAKELISALQQMRNESNPLFDFLKKFIHDPIVESGGSSN